MIKRLYRPSLAKPVNNFQQRTFFNPIQDTLSKYITSIWNQVTSSELKNGYDEDNASKPYVFKMIPLHDQNSLSNDEVRNECTVYVKGFLSSHTNRSLVLPVKRAGVADDPDDFTFDRSHFQFWKTSHQVLVQRDSHRWAENMYGWDWPNGRFPHQFNFSSTKQKEEHEMMKKIGKIDPRDEIRFNPMSYIPVPVATLVAVAYQIVTAVYKRSWIRFTPSVIIGSLLHDVAFTVVVGYLEFQQADRNASQYAHLLRDELFSLNNRYSKVRVVAHSLGAKHAIEAIKGMPVDDRPSEVHLCAAAVPEKEVDEVFHEGLTNRRENKNMTYSYWSDEDFLLNTIYRTVTLGEVAIGSADLLGRYDRVKSIFVPVEHFPQVYGQSIVHNMYGPSFYKFANSPHLHHHP